MSDMTTLTMADFAHNSRLRKTTILILIALVLIAAVEAMLPPGAAIWVLFIPTIALSIFTQRPKVPIILAAFCSIWIFFDHFLFEINSDSLDVLIRRTIGSSAIFVVAFIVRYAILVNLNELKTKLELEKTASDLAKEKLKLERSNRELEQFAGVAAHDLRSPIATIYSWVDMLDHLSPPPRNPELDQAMTIIKNNAKKAGDLIDDVLEIARVNVSVSNIVQIDLNRTLSDVLVTLQQQINGAKILVDPLPTVQGNQTYMASIFSNLIRNALIYRDKTRTPEITIGYAEQMDTFEFFVKDNGIGIDPKFTDRIFEMFKRLHGEKEYPGTGIGLAFCKKVVELSGGKIWVDSQPGQGSTFRFTYPKVWGGKT